jgi:hypothetical protein
MDEFRDETVGVGVLVGTRVGVLLGTRVGVLLGTRVGVLVGTGVGVDIESNPVLSSPSQATSNNINADSMNSKIDFSFIFVINELYLIG